MITAIPYVQGTLYLTAYAQQFWLSISRLYFIHGDTTYMLPEECCSYNNF